MWWGLFEPKAYDAGFMETEDGHRVFYQQMGNPKGVPVLAFHGGPGGSSKPKMAEMFDPKRHRIIAFDQRGSAKSECADLTINNTTQLLLSDAKALLDMLGVTDKIISYGVSWGSTMALLFAIKYPNTVKALAVGAIFLARRKDNAWLNKDSALFYPDLAHIRAEGVDGGRAVNEYYRELAFSKDEEKVRRAFKYYAAYERLLGELDPAFPENAELDQEEIKSMQVFLHYDTNDYFLPDNYILDNAATIKDIPCFICHNRMDFCCPVEQAFLLHQALPKSQLKILPLLAHTGPKFRKMMRTTIADELRKIDI